MLKQKGITTTQTILIIAVILLLILIISRANRRQDLQEGVPEEIDIDIPGSMVKKISLLATSSYAGRVDWSHANNLIAFSKVGDDGYADIYTMNSDGSNKTCLTCGAVGVPQFYNDQPVWHPSGDYIIFQAQDPNLSSLSTYLVQGGAGLNNNLWAISKDGQRSWQLTHIEDREATLHSHFSHDGKKLLWAARELQDGKKAQWMLKIADFIVDGGGPRLANEKTYQPMGENVFYESHSFTHDGQKIIFSASYTAPAFDLDIYILDLRTNKLTNLTNSPGEWDEHSILSPNNRLAWISSKGYSFTPSANWGATLKTDLWLMNLDGSNKTKVTHFNEPGYPEYESGKRVIAADNSWNKTGDKLVLTLGVIKGKTVGSRVVLVEFNSPQ
ncbi:MAG: hypothetical protein G01um101430_125 [Parcubacteria group bacterium Gr01-1014_30]|nr:MAG: hypothetical protein G01um101430_125 [Parcubacteria group bacterium Gr01-1014_30]